MNHVPDVRKLVESPPMTDGEMPECNHDSKGHDGLCDCQRGERLLREFAIGKAYEVQYVPKYIQAQVDQLTTAMLEEEREACAKIAESQSMGADVRPRIPGISTGRVIARLIRARPSPSLPAGGVV